MSKINRRDFIGTTALGVSAVAAVGCGRAPALDEAAIVAMGEVLLPSELGDAGRRRVTADFLTWASNFRPGAELNHGYGTGELSHSGEDPVPRWAGQVAMLESVVRDRFAGSVAGLTHDQRKLLLGEAIAAFPDARLASPQNAEHVAVALMSFFYNTPQATDLAYRASIKRHQCRPLRDSPHKPIALG